MTGRIDPFQLAAQDLADRLMVPERLYGRESEIAALVDSFERVARDGRQSLVLVSGSAFPLAPALRSTASATGSPALFGGFTATMAESDFSESCIGDYGSSPSHRGP